MSVADRSKILDEYATVDTLSARRRARRITIQKRTRREARDVRQQLREAAVLLGARRTVAV